MSRACIVCSVPMLPPPVMRDLAAQLDAIGLVDLRLHENRRGVGVMT